jgi:hypothetical protein
MCGEAARFAEAFVTGSYVVHTAPQAEQLLKSLGRRRAWKGVDDLRRDVQYQDYLQPVFERVVVSGMQNFLPV